MRRWLWAIATAISFTGALAQKPPARVRARIDYIANRNLYVAAGMGQGLFAGDTAMAYKENSLAPLGRVLIVSSTRSRAMALMVDSLAISAGDILDFAVPDSAIARMQAAAQARQDSTKAMSPAPTISAPRTSRVVTRGVTVNGRLGIDLDALMTRSQWGTAGELEDRHTYTTPAMRLRAYVSGLPGGLQLNTNLRAQYHGGQPARSEQFSARVYQASLGRDYSLLRFQLGRFYNPYESHSGYWDGVLLRLGGNGAGAGVALGYTPLAGNEAFSTMLPKATAFVDLHHRNADGSVRWDAGASFHQQTSEFIDGKRNFVGVSQQLGLRGFYLTQRAQFGRTEADPWSLWQLQSSLSLNLSRPLQATARYTAERIDLFSDRPGASPLRTRWSGGLNLSASGMFASAEAGLVSSADGSQGRMMQGTLIIPRTVLGLGFGLTGSRWQEGDLVSTFLAPSVDRAFGHVRVHAAGHYSLTEYAISRFAQQGYELSLGIPLGGRAELLLSATSSSSLNSSSTRFLTSIWQSF